MNQEQTWRGFIWAGLTIFALLVLGGSLVEHTAQAATPTPGTKHPKFIVFDARAGRFDHAEANAAGMEPLLLFYQGNFFKSKSAEDMANADESMVHNLGDMLVKDKTPYACVDIEYWPVRGEEKTTAETVHKLVAILDRLRAAAPNCKIACYSIPPIRDYWRALKGPGDQGYQDWVKENQRLAKVAQHSDVIFPSIYTFYDDKEGWKKYALANIREAKKYGKPVYPFLMPWYHESNKKLGGQLIPPDFWRIQLETCFENAAGVCVWGSYPKGFNSSEPWWQETLKFMKDKGLTPPESPESPAKQP